MALKTSATVRCARSMVILIESHSIEVRLAAIFAIQALSATSTAFAIRSLDFLVDMFNDEIDQVWLSTRHCPKPEKVRVAAITCLQHSGSSTVYYEEQLDTMLGVLDVRYLAEARS